MDKDTIILCLWLAVPAGLFLLAVIGSVIHAIIATHDWFIRTRSAIRHWRWKQTEEYKAYVIRENIRQVLVEEGLIPKPPDVGAAIQAAWAEIKAKKQEGQEAGRQALGVDADPAQGKALQVDADPAPRGRRGTMKKALNVAGVVIPCALFWGLAFIRSGQHLFNDCLDVFNASMSPLLYAIIPVIPLLLLIWILVTLEERRKRKVEERRKKGIAPLGIQDPAPSLQEPS